MCGRFGVCFSLVSDEQFRPAIADFLGFSLIPYDLDGPDEMRFETSTLEGVP